MVCTALMDQDDQPRYRTLLTQHAEPVIYGLQQVLQKTWDAGMRLSGSCRANTLNLRSRHRQGGERAFVPHPEYFQMDRDVG